MTILETIVELSREFGAPEYVKGGGGNTSAKTVDTLWVKPSGTTLAGLTETTFVEMDRARLGDMFKASVPTESSAREALVKDMMAAAVNPGQKGRPSVEAPLHDVLSSTFVVHTHPPLVNALTCGKDGAAACARLFPDALWIPYIDPGYTLCMEVRQRVKDHAARTGRQPSVLVLENHGIFVQGDTAEEIRASYAAVLGKLKDVCLQSGVDLELKTGEARPSVDAERTSGLIRTLLAEEGAFVEWAPLCGVPEGPLTPDHIVYAKSFPHTGAVTAESIADFQAKRGYLPKIFITPAGIFAAGPTEGKTKLSLLLALDGALVRQLAEAFGGAKYLDDRSREFIENWEVESYRQKQMG